jgi:O-antigen/teichoic acid export membrane protein
LRNARHLRDPGEPAPPPHKSVIDAETAAGPQTPHVDESQRLIHKVAGSAVNLVGRLGMITLLSAIRTIAITRLLGPSGFGVYGAAVAVSAVLGAFADFGFSLMLSRDMATDTGAHRALLRSGYEVAGAWSLLLAGAMVVMALTAPLSSQRGLALLVLAPSMAFNGLNPARVFFLVTYRTGRLVRIDVVTALVQMIVTIGVATAHLGPVAVAAVVSAGTIVNSVVVAVAAHRMLEPQTGPAGTFSRLELIRRSAPLGLVSVMTKVYLTIDLVLLGWYVSGPKLGDYAAAAKLLTVLAGVAGTVMTGVLPALASTQRIREELNELVERVWHWLMVSAVPMFVGVALFAPLIIDVAFGHDYRGAVSLIRILSIAGGVTVVSNLVGNIMVAKRRMRALFLQNLAAIVLNVGGNLVLIPRYGVYAAAWMTSVTEILVCSAAVISLRRDLHFGQLLKVSWRPALATILGSATAVALIGTQWLALVAGGAVFLMALTVLRAWPQELTLRLKLPAHLLSRMAGQP